MHRVNPAGLQSLLPSSVIPLELGGEYVADVTQIQQYLQAVIDTH